MKGEPEPDFTGETIPGSLARYVATPNRDFQPMNANFGILDPFGKPIRAKKMRYEALSARSLKRLGEIASHLN
jgi:methylenetetrahydrofolate--tRNA-(uracil-5-)-methyltransferase